MFIKVVWGLAFFPLFFFFVSGERARKGGAGRLAGCHLLLGRVKTLQHTGEAMLLSSLTWFSSCSSFFLHAGATGAALAAVAHGPGHEVDGHHETQGQHGILRLTSYLCRMYTQDMENRMTRTTQEEARTPRAGRQQLQGQRQEPVGQENPARPPAGGARAGLLATELGLKYWDRFETAGQNRGTAASYRESQGFCASWARWLSSLAGLLPHSEKLSWLPGYRTLGEDRAHCSGHGFKHLSGRAEPVHWPSAAFLPASYPALAGCTAALEGYFTAS